MKKVLFGLMLMGVAIIGTGCKKEKITISADNVSKNSIVVKEDGSMQSSLVSEFSKDYYKETDLSAYISDELTKFNNENSTSVALNSVGTSGDNVCAVFDYPSAEDFSTYATKDSLYVSEELSSDEEKKVTAELLSADDAKSSDLVPDDINKYGKDSTKSKNKALKSKYKVFVLDNSAKAIDGTVEITVDGDIEYSYNVEKVDKNTAKISDLEGVAVIVFEP